MFESLKAFFARKPDLKLFVPDEHVCLAIASKHPRSSRWPAKRADILLAHPFCAVCGNKSNLNVHHIKPYHLFPELELADSNLIVLCEGPVVNCHFLFGHLRNWKAYNPEVVRLTAAWSMALQAATANKPVSVAS